jgi:outer membrane protein TolC
MAVAASQLPDPTLTAGVNNLPINGPDQFSLTSDFMTMRSISILQQFTRSDKREARAARFGREAEAAETGRTLALANLQRDTALAWFDRHFQERVLQILTMQRDEARLQVDAADAAYRGVRGSQTDALSARSAVAQMEDRVAQADRQVATAKIRLRRWVGDAANLPLGPAPNTEAFRVQWADLEDHIAHHPQIEVMLRQEQLARAEAEIAQANKRPDWSAELMYSQRGPAYSNMISFGVAIPLQWDQKSRQDREVAAKLALAEQAEAQRDDALRAHVAEVRSMIQEWESLRERRARYVRELLPLATERTQAVLTAYRGAKASLTEVLAARRSEIEVRMQTLQLEMEQARLWAQLNFLLPHATSLVGVSQ